MTNKMAARARIIELWQFKAQKVEKLYEDFPAIFKPIYGEGFLDAAKNVSFSVVTNDE